MKTCKDCIHYDVCNKQKITNHKISQSVCKHFKDKSLVLNLPCKVGDTVYAIGDKNGNQIKECIVSDFSFASAENFQVNVCFECDYDCDGCYFNDWSQSYCGEWSCNGEYGNGLISVDDFGKTVFLTKESAEQALKEMQSNG